MERRTFTFTLDDGGGGGTAGGGEGETSTVGETGEEGGSDGAAGGEGRADVAGGTSAAPGDPLAWDGQIASIEKQPWWAMLSEDARLGVRSGLESTLKGWQRAYTGKFEEAATLRREAEDAQKTAEEATQTWLRLVGGEDDPVGARDAKIAELEGQIAQLKAEGPGKLTATAQAEIQKALEAEKVKWEAERGELVSARDAATSALESYATSIESAYQEHLADWLGKNAPDFAEDAMAPALEMFLTLHAQGQDLDTSLKMVRVKHPAPVSTPERVPDDIATMSLGDRSMRRDASAAGDVWERLRRETTEVAAWPTRG